MPGNLDLLVRHAIGRAVVIELNDESSVRGVVQSCDECMNIHLENVEYFRRRNRTGPAIKLESFFARSRYIRFIHLKEINSSIVKEINQKYFEKGNFD